MQDPTLLKPWRNDVIMLMCRISFCLTITFLMPIDRTVYAEWVALDGQYQSHPLQTVYIDLDTFHREGQMVVLSVLINWKAMQGGRTPTRFYSTKFIKQVDCVEKLVRTLAATDFYGQMGTGEIIGGDNPPTEGHWVSLEPGTINHGVWKAACGKG